MSLNKIKKTEGGSGGKRGHGNMSHWFGTEEIKNMCRKLRRILDKKLAKEEQ